MLPQCGGRCPSTATFTFVSLPLHVSTTPPTYSSKDEIGETAEVVRAIPSRERVILEGVNVAKRHAKPTRATQQGGVIDKFMPVHVSTVALICKSCDKPTRAGFRIEDDGEKVRICKKCGSVL